MNSDRNEFIDRWAQQVKSNPDWRKEHTRFINAQAQQANEFYRRLAKQPEGQQRIRRITGASKKLIASLIES